MPTINFRDVKPLGDYAALPAGVYAVEITAAEMKKSKAQNDMLAVEYTVRPEVDGFAGRKVWDMFAFTPESMDFVSRKVYTLLLAVGYTEDDLTAEDFDIDQELALQLIGYELNITVGTRQGTGEYEGKTQNTVSNYAPIEETAAS